MTAISIAELIDETLGIRGPQDLLNLVLGGVSIVFVLVGILMSTMDTFSFSWWSLLGFECIALLLSGSCIYVVHIVLPSLAKYTKTDKVEE